MPGQEQKEVAVDDRHRLLTEAGVDQEQDGDDQIAACLVRPEGPQEAEEGEGAQAASGQGEDVPWRGLRPQPRCREEIHPSEDRPIRGVRTQRSGRPEEMYKPSVRPIVPEEAIARDIQAEGQYGHTDDRQVRDISCARQPAQPSRPVGKKARRSGDGGERIHRNGPSDSRRPGAKRRGAVSYHPPRGG